MEQLQNSDGLSPRMQGERTAWSTVLLWGLLLAGAASFITALWRRLHTRGRPARPPAEMDLAGTEPAVIGSLPGEITATPSVPRTAAGMSLPQPSQGSLSESAAEACKQVPAHPSLAPATEKPAPSHPAQPTRWREPTKYIVGIGLFLAILFILYISRSVLPIIILAALLALIVHPVIRFLQKRLKLSKGLSVAITYLLIIVLLVLIPLILVPVIISSVDAVLSIDFQGLSQNVSQALQDLSAQVADIPVLNWLLGPFLDSLAAATEGISSAEMPEPVSYEVAMGGIIERLASTLGAIAKLLGPVVSAIVSLAFMLLVSFYLSVSGDAIMESYPRLFPPAIDLEMIALVQRIEGVWVRFLRGQFTLMALIGTMIFLGNAILGNPNALLLGIISGMLELIPNLGPALALIPGVGMALVFGSTHFDIPNLTFAVIVLAYYLLVQVFENQVVVPYLLGGAVDLPPLVVILGVMVGGTVAGILGVLLATPTIATGREVFGYLYNKILEPPMVEAPPQEKPSLMDSVRDRVRQVRLPFGRRARSPAAPEGQELNQS